MLLSQQTLPFVITRAATQHVHQRGGIPGARRLQCNLKIGQHIFSNDFQHYVVTGHLETIAKALRRRDGNEAVCRLPRASIELVVGNDQIGRATAYIQRSHSDALTIRLFPARQRVEELFGITAEIRHDLGVQNAPAVRRSPRPT